MNIRAQAAAALLIALTATSHGYAQDDSAAALEELSQPIIEARATQAAIWGMPAVNYDLMRQEMLRAGGKVNAVIYWSRPLDWHNQTLTPNPDSIYLMAFYNTKDVGPVVIEVPPAGEDGSINGNIVTIWQMPLEDTGLSGADKGAGGKYLLLPPGYAEKVPDGYIPLRSDTFGGYALLRSNLKSHGDADVAKSVAYGKRVRVYPLSQADNPPETVFTDMQGQLFDSTIRYDASFFENLNRIVQEEPWLERDRAMIDQLKSLGIENGKPFAPDATTKTATEAGIGKARDWLEAKYQAGFPPFWEGSRWMFPALPDLVKALQTSFSEPDSYPVDARGLVYTYAFIGLKRLGAGQFYLISIKDSDGKTFDGSKTYRLHVPPDVPVEQYWSVTLYDRETHALIKNMDRASRASNASDVQKNEDGSVDIYFGPKPPEGKAANWVPTDPDRKFEAMFRLYAPTKALFEKTWVLPDIEEVNQ